MKLNTEHLKLKTLTAFFGVLCALAVNAQTPVYDWGYIAPGVPQTNPFIIQPWPLPANQWLTFNVTNSVYVFTTTNTPNSSGYWSNSIYPTGYRQIIPAYNTIRYFTVPNTTQAVSIAQCAIGVPATASTLSTYQLITNWLGYAPPVPTPAGITTALGFTPVTNSYFALTNVLGFVPATNFFGANTNVMFLGNNSTNTAYYTNGILFRTSTP